MSASTAGSRPGTRKRSSPPITAARACVVPSRTQTEPDRHTGQLAPLTGIDPTDHLPRSVRAKGPAPAGRSGERPGGWHAQTRSGHDRGIAVHAGPRPDGAGEVVVAVRRIVDEYR